METKHYGRLGDDTSPSKISRSRPRARLQWTACATGVGDIAGLLPLVLVVGSVGAIYASTVLVLLALSGEYRERATLSLADDLPRLVMRLALPAVVIGATLASATTLPVLLEWVLVSMVLVGGGRAVVYALLRRSRNRTRAGERTVIVGAGEIGQRIARTLLDHPAHGLLPVGFVDRVADEGLPLPLLGCADELAAILDRHHVSSVVVAFGPSREADLVDALRGCKEAGIGLRVVPRLFELGASGSALDADDVLGIPLHRIAPAAQRQPSWRVKRAIDVVVAAAGLVVLAPALAAIAVAVRATSPGPALLRQPRVGQGGRVFDVLKFRTMYVNDDGDTTWTVTRDPRVTPLGRVLRPTSVDELPQLWNVLRGEMSLVGPRPERPFYVEQFSNSVRRYGDRHRVPTGITGLSQVAGLRGDSSIEDRSIVDNQYIDRWSLWQDLVILVRTGTAVVRPPATVKVQEPQVIDLREPLRTTFRVPHAAVREMTVDGSR